jgi:hypothetical protein
MVSPLGSVKEHCSKLRAVAGEQMSEEDFNAAAQKSVTIIEQALIATKSPKDFYEAIEILRLLGGTTLTSGSLAALSGEILAKVGVTMGRPVASPARQLPQSCLYLHNLLGQHQWETIVSDLLNWYQKEDYMIEIMDDLGLSNSSEKTKTLVTCILFMASSPEETLTVNKMDFFQKRCSLVDKISCRFKHRAAHHGQVDNYPETAAEFVRRFPDAAATFYGKDPAKTFSAVECPLDLAALCNLTERMPTRKTHGDVAVAIRMHSLPKQFKRTGVGQLCRGETGMLPSILQGNLDLTELEEMLPGFKILRQDAPPPPWASHFQRPCDGLANGLHTSEQQAMDPSGRPSAPQALENAATTSLVPWVPSAGFKGKSKSLDSMAELLLGKSKSAGPDSEASSLAAIAKQPAAKQPCLKRPAAAALVSTGPKAAKVAMMFKKNNRQVRRNRTQKKT